MRVDRSIGMVLLLIAFGSSGAPSRGADAASESLLKRKGLAKSGHAFVIEAETPVLAKMKELRVALDSYTAQADRQARAEQVASQVAQYAERRGELQAELDDLNQQINLQGSQPNNNLGRPGAMALQQGVFTSRLIDQRDQIKNYLAEIKFQEEAKSESPPDRELAELDESLKQKKDALKKVLEELRPLVDGVEKNYADLAQDPFVKQALTVVKKTSRLRLGPSDAFLAGEKTLARAEQRVLGKTTAVIPKKKKAKSRR